MKKRPLEAGMLREKRSFYDMQKIASYEAARFDVMSIS